MNNHRQQIFQAVFCWAVLCLFPLTVHALEISRPPFLIVAADKDADIAERSAGVLLDAMGEFGERLPAGEEVIRVVIAESDAAFAHHAGPMAALDVSGIARSWAGFIAVKAPYLVPAGSDYAGTLRHELLHVLLFRNTNTDYMPRWLNEGISMMLSNEFRWESSFSVAQMFLEGRLIEYRVLDSALAAPESGMQFGDAYAQSLSMTRTLRDQLGEEKFWAVIMGMKSMPFPDAMRAYGGVSPMSFWEGYRASLWQLAFWAALTPGTLLSFGGILLVLTWYMKQRSNRLIVKRWEREEREDALYGSGLTTWEEVVEDPNAWKRGKGDDSGP